MMQVHSILCPKTGMQCKRTPCLQGLKCVIGDPSQGISQHIGWKCPVCGKGNAPFMQTCGNTACGINFNAPTCAIGKI